MSDIATVVETLAPEVSAAAVPAHAELPSPEVITESDISKDSLLTHLRKIENVGEMTKKQIRAKLLEDFSLDVSSLPKDEFMLAIETIALEQSPPKEEEEEHSELDEDSGDDEGDEGDEDDDYEDPVVTEAPASWREKMGELYWVMSFKMWWPCYVFNPSKMSKRAAIGKTALKKVGKEHLVYYYGTGKGSDFGFIKDEEKLMKPFADAETRAKALAQKITSKKSREQFAEGLAVADKDALLKPQERVVWLFPERKPRAPRTSSTPKKKRVSSAASSSTVAKTAMSPASRKPKITKQTLTGVPGNKLADTTDNQLAVESISEEPEDEQEEEEEEFDEDFVEQKKSRKESNRNDKKEKKQLEREKERSNKRERESEELKPAGKKPRPSNPKPKIIPVLSSAAKVLAAESSADRARRLVGLLQLNTSAMPFTAEHSTKAVKTMEKLKVIDISLGEMQSTGVAAAVVGLRKHTDVAIAAAANALRNYWKEKYAAAGSVTAPVATPAVTDNAIV